MLQRIRALGARFGRTFGSTAALFFGAIVVATTLYRAWGGVGSEPLEASIDHWVHITYAQNLIAGDLNHTSALGAPFGQNLLDFPLGDDLLHFVLWHVLALFTSNPIAVVNLGFLIGFGLAAVSAELVARMLGLGRWSSIFVGVAFAFLPYHFLEGVSRPFLSAIWAVPPGALLAIWAAQDRLPVPGLHVGGGIGRRQVIIGVIALVIATTSDPYYTFFTVVLVVIGGVVAQLRRLSVASIMRTATVVVAAFGIFLVTMVSSTLWRWQHGENAYVAVRSVADTENWSLHLSQLLVPEPSYRIGAIAELGTRVRDVASPSEPGSYVGVLAIIGLVSALVMLARNGLTSPRGRREFLSIIGAMSLGGFLVATVGGLSTVIAAVGFTQIRVWLRLAVFLGFFGLLATGSIPWSPVHRWLERSQFNRRLTGVALVAVILLDQVPSSVSSGSAHARQILDQDRQLTTQLDATFPQGSMMFQLPVISYPEAGFVHQLDGYALLVPRIVDRGHLRWSYGGMRGRQADWQLNWGNEPPQAMTAGLALAGFDALVADRSGFADGGRNLVYALWPLLGAPHTVGDSHYWWDLRPLRARMQRDCGVSGAARARQAILHGVVARAATPHDPPRPGFAEWFETQSELSLANQENHPQKITVLLDLSAIQNSTVRFVGDGVDASFAVGPERREVRFPVEVPSGGTTLRVTTDAPIDQNAPSLRPNSYSAAIRIDRIETIRSEVTSCLAKAGIDG